MTSIVTSSLPKYVPINTIIFYVSFVKLQLNQITCKTHDYIHRYNCRLTHIVTSALKSSITNDRSRLSILYFPTFNYFFFQHLSIMIKHAYYQRKITFLNKDTIQLKWLLPVVVLFVESEILTITKQGHHRIYL